MSAAFSGGGLRDSGFASLGQGALDSDLGFFQLVPCLEGAWTPMGFFQLIPCLEGAFSLVPLYSSVCRQFLIS